MPAASVLPAPRLSARVVGYGDRVPTDPSHGAPVTRATGHSGQDGDRDPRDLAAEAAWIGEGPDALRVAYDSFGSLLFTYCLRSLGDREVAADCVQETFISAWRSRARFDPERGPLVAWLIGIARYRVLDAHRAAGRVPIPTEVADRDATGDGRTGEDERLVDRLLLARFLKSLEPRPRSVLELAFWSDLSQAEIAAELDIPLGTVKSDMRRSLIRLRVEMKGGVYDDERRAR